MVLISVQKDNALNVSAFYAMYATFTHRFRKFTVYI